MRMRRKPWARPELEHVNFLYKSQVSIKEDGKSSLEMISLCIWN